MTRLLATLLGFSSIVVAACCTGAVAQSYTVLHEFSGLDGEYPVSGLTTGPDGSLYGTTQFGGPNIQQQRGVVFRSDPSGNVTVLHAFTLSDGAGPQSGSLTLIDDRLYGGTPDGGANGCGVVYSVGIDGGDYTVVYNFGGETGCEPTGPVQRDGRSGLVGVAEFGGPGFKPGVYHPGGKGLLFTLSRNGDFQQLHDFGAVGDGAYPDTVLVDRAGVLFGSTIEGGGPCGPGPAGCGTIFRLDRTSGQYSVLYSFTNSGDGSAPILGSIGPDGTLYGVTQTGKGVTRFGTLFALQPSAGGYRLVTYAAFGKTLGYPVTGPILTAQGHLVGTSVNGLYAYDPLSLRGTVLQALVTTATGMSAMGQPAIGVDGSIYGTTALGGLTPCAITGGCGVIFRYIPR